MMSYEEEKKGDAPNLIVKAQIESSFLIIGFKKYEHACPVFSKYLE